jgi:hypothetical protein
MAIARNLAPIWLFLLACSASTSGPTRGLVNARWTRWDLREPPLADFSPRSSASQLPPAPGLGWLDIVKRAALARETVAGRLEVFLSPTAEGEGYELRLGSRLVAKSSYELMNAGVRHGLEPWIAGSLGRVEAFDEVLLVGWAAVGNACWGYGVTFVGVRRDGGFSVADIPFCGGPEPLVQVTATKVTVTIPEHPPNRGKGRKPRETYVYAAGKVVSLP